ncbi:GTP-binding protein RAD [Callorhinchus milii]|uniref:GTP-binding protein n=1 Tax=Callorhinchus milii TaxID=7868 RepID=V9KN21_CALMI|nr:GTP-binding protein RAD [Callorhinchus milii]|eukprot:gi/632978710/ref/XP_007906067.1/ PREDICTED: GTP-binding protein RAD [Callorhinchus milii]
MTLNKTDKLRSLERRRGSMPVPQYQAVHRCSMPLADRELSAAIPALQQGSLVRCTSYSPGHPQRESWTSGSSDSVISSGSDMDTCVHKVVLLGGHRVGRSSLAHIFGGVEDSEPHEAGERENTYDRTILVDDEEANLIVFDIWQQDESSRLQEHCMKLGDAYLIVYSVTDRASFDKASELRIQLRRARQAEDIPIILVGNKTDLVRSREVSVDEGRACAVVFDCKFIETSAALHHNVTDLFEGIVRQIRLRTDSKEDNLRRLACTKRRQSLGQKAKRFLGKLAAKNNKKMAFKQKSKSCHDLSVL